MVENILHHAVEDFNTRLAKNERSVKDGKRKQSAFFSGNCHKCGKPGHIRFKAQVTTMPQATIEPAKKNLMVTIKAMGETATIAPLSKKIAGQGKAASKGSNRTKMVEATAPIIPSSRLLAPMNLKNIIGMEEKNFGVTITTAGCRHMEQMTVM